MPTPLEILTKTDLGYEIWFFWKITPQLQHLMLNIRPVIKYVNDYLPRHLTYKIDLEK